MSVILMLTMSCKQKPLLQYVPISPYSHMSMLNILKISITIYRIKEKSENGNRNVKKDNWIPLNKHWRIWQQDAELAQQLGIMCLGTLIDVPAWENYLAYILQGWMPGAKPETYYLGRARPCCILNYSWRNEYKPDEGNTRFFFFFSSSLPNLAVQLGASKSWFSWWLLSINNENENSV